MSKTGTYKVDKVTGEVVKVSDRVPVIKKIADWKRNMNAHDETRRAFASMEDKGTLGAVDDRDVQADYVVR